MGIRSIELWSEDRKMIYKALDELSTNASFRAFKVRDGLFYQLGLILCTGFLDRNR